jgi:signal transduction histidine kinase
LPAGGRVRVRIARRDACLVVEVTDDGPGIPAEFREKIFQPFFTTKPSGTGLGLAIVERRLGEMQGNIALVTPVENGCGTRFIVTLPIVD